MSSALARVAELVRCETGVVISDPQLPALAASLARIAAAMDAGRFLCELADPTRRAWLMARLVDEVTIKETFFFRELMELQTLDWPRMLDSAAASGCDTVRVWVAACATGEEAYGLAILACEALGTSRPPVAILATDVSSAAIERAAAATYAERSMRLVSAELRERYFVSDAGRYVVSSAVRSLVRLRSHNLVTEPAPPVGEVPFDVIACRNVLIYFGADTTERVIGALGSALRPSGRLILGSADRLSETVRRLGRGAPRAQAGARRPPTAPIRALRRPLGLEARRPAVAAPVPRREGEGRVAEALRAADAGDLDVSIAIVGRLLAEEPMNADACFVQGLAELGLGDAEGAATSFRRALYVDPSFGLAAFQLGRANDARGATIAATRAYEQALRTLDPDADGHRVILDKVDLADIAAACRARLRPS